MNNNQGKAEAQPIVIWEAAGGSGRSGRQEQEATVRDIPLSAGASSGESVLRIVSSGFGRQKGWGGASSAPQGLRCAA